MSAMAGVPIVDFSALGVDKSDDLIGDDDVRRLAKELMEAFTTIGFVYLTKHGVAQDELEDVHELSREFFAQTRSVKDKYHRTRVHGYTRMKEETFSEFTGGDLKECYDICPSLAEIWPDEIKDFEERSMKFYRTLEKLARRILQVIAVGLGIEPQDIVPLFAGVKNQSYTNLRLLYYPPLPDGVKPPQVRLGEHTDYGAFTLLFQDSVGGLEVKSADGQWIDASPVPDTVLVNIADLMQRWSSDILKSTPHRVVIPDLEFRKKTARYSTVLFVHPDQDTVIQCFDGSDKYPPIKAGDYVASRFRSTYKDYVD